MSLLISHTNKEKGYSYVRLIHDQIPSISVWINIYHEGSHIREQYVNDFTGCFRMLDEKEFLVGYKYQRINRQGCFSFMGTIDLGDDTYNYVIGGGIEYGRKFIVVITSDREIIKHT